MTRAPITVSENAAIDEAALVILEKKISGLPVMDTDRKLVGIITESDIFRILVQPASGQV